ncbi:MAG: YhcH/YjgK/YiaL family protein [Candidatus Cryptobacteroides sp.]|jgi:YhcH/YjgK/YiaL family protein
MKNTLLEKNPWYRQALDYIQSHDLSDMEPGHYEIDGNNLFVNIVDSQMKTKAEARLEVHDRYIDIQIPLSKPETYGIKARKDCTRYSEDRLEKDDIAFFPDPVEQTFSAEPGEIVTFSPDTAHAPLIGEGVIRKAIFKVAVV